MPMRVPQRAEMAQEAPLLGAVGRLPACTRVAPWPGLSDFPMGQNQQTHARRLVDPKLTAEVRQREPLLEAAEIVPVAAKCGHPPSSWCNL